MAVTQTVRVCSHLHFVNVPWGEWSPVKCLGHANEYKMRIYGNQKRLDEMSEACANVQPIRYREFLFSLIMLMLQYEIITIYEVFCAHSKLYWTINSQAWQIFPFFVMLLLLCLWLFMFQVVSFCGKENCEGECMQFFFMMLAQVHIVFRQL